MVAALEFQTLFIPYFEVVGGAPASPRTSLLVLLGLSRCTQPLHLILRRAKVREASAQTTSGWALGAAMGGMQGLFLSAHCSTPRGPSTVRIGGLEPPPSAIVSASPGHLDRLARSFDAAGTTCRCRRSRRSVAHGAPQPRLRLLPAAIWLAAAVLLLSMDPRVSAWVWDGLSPQAKRALRRVRAERAREQRTREREEE